MGKFGETFLNWEVMAQYAPRIVEGFFVTLQLAAVIVVAGLSAGLLLALIRTFRVRAVNIFIVLAVDVLRAELALHTREVRRLHEKLFYRPLLSAVARVPGEQHVFHRVVVQPRAELIDLDRQRHRGHGRAIERRRQLLPR